MAKFGWDDRELFNVNNVGLENLSSTPSNPPAGELKLYFRSGTLYKLDSAGTETAIDTNTGEANTASNVNVGGVGVFKQKTGFDLEFRGINAASSKISVALDAANNEIDLDVVEANIDHDSLSGFVAGEHTDAQVKVSANDTTPGYLEDKIVVSDGTNTSNALELSTLNDGADEDVQIQFDESKITVTSSQVSDFNEAAQDAVGSILVDSASIDFTYDDGANTITAAVIPGGVDHGSLSGLGDDDHTQYLLLGGRAGGQIANGGTAASEDLELRSTSNATKGIVKIVDGSDMQHFDRRMTQASLQTTDATESTCGSITLADNRVYNAIIRVVARRSDGGGEARGSWQFQACVYRAGAGAVIEKSVKQEFKAASAYDADIDVSSNDLRVRVTGAASQDVEWKAYIDYVESD